MNKEEYILWFRKFMEINDSEYKEYFSMDGLDMIEAAMKFELEFKAVIDDDKLDEITFKSHKEFVDFLFTQIP